MDPAAATPRDRATPYLPAERYPFEPPFTAEEMGYRSMEFPHLSRWSHVMADVFGSITGRGFLQQGILVMLALYVPGEGLPGHIYHTAPGQDYYRTAFYYVYPPETSGTQELWILHRTDLTATTKIDYFTYTPDLRRVRRQPQPRRSQRFPNNVQTFDDVIGRDAWEFTWRIIGTDTLRETVRFPKTRPRFTLASADGTFRDLDAADLKLMGDTYPGYTGSGGVECYVVESVPRPEWLPGYNLSKLIYWLDRRYFYPLRIEQYDQEGRLLLIEVRVAKLENPALGDRGYAALMTVYYDVSLDMISYSVHDGHRPTQWSAAERHNMFRPDFMRRGWLKHVIKSRFLPRDPSEFFLRPHLHRGKFPGERAIELAPDVESRLRAQESAGRLVFD